MGGPEALTCWLSARDRQGFLPGPSPWGWPELRAVGLKLWGSLQDEKVWSYAGGQLRPGFPRLIGDEFPGVPGGLDAAVECHPEECGGETVLFFKGERRGGGLWGARGCVAVPHHMSHAAPYEPCCAIQAVPLPCAGDKVFSFDLELRVTKERPWLDAGPCDAALRWLERYYCLQGTQFYRFRPHSWEVLPGYPRDLRDYFIPCPGRGEAPLGLSQASAAF